MSGDTHDTVDDDEATAPATGMDETATPVASRPVTETNPDGYWRGVSRAERQERLDAMMAPYRKSSGKKRAGPRRV